MNLLLCFSTLLQVFCIRDLLQHRQALSPSYLSEEYVLGHSFAQMFEDKYSLNYTILASVWEKNVDHSKSDFSFILRLLGVFFKFFFLVLPSAC